MARNTAASVVVVGSMNVDLIASVKRLPGPGETVAAAGLEKRFGGKGANQALAASRHGAQVTLAAWEMIQTDVTTAITSGVKGSIAVP